MSHVLQSRSTYTRQSLGHENLRFTSQRRCVWVEYQPYFAVFVLQEQNVSSKILNAYCCAPTVDCIWTSLRPALLPLSLHRSFDTTAGFVPLVQRLLRVSRIDAHDARAAALKLLHDEKSQVWAILLGR
jgi:hypothetical protein